jgi:hypothetical protein
MHKLTLLATGLVCLCLSGTISGQPPESPPVPDRVASRFAPEGPPWWMSARAVTRSDGEIDWSLFRPSTQRNLQDWIRSDRYREQGCLGPYDVHVTLGNRPRIGSFPELVLQSKAIYGGTVARAQGGFLFDQPGTLLQVSVEQVLKAGEDFSVEDYVYVFYPQGDFRVGRYQFCIRNSEYPEVPPRGTRILLLPSVAPEDAGRKLIYPYLGEVFVETPEGGLGVPQIWKAEIEGRGLKTWEDLRTAVADVLATEEEGALP